MTTNLYHPEYTLQVAMVHLQLVDRRVFGGSTTSRAPNIQQATEEALRASSLDRIYLWLSKSLEQPAKTQLSTGLQGRHGNL